MELRSYIVPAVQLSSKLAPWLFFCGILLDLSQLAWAGVILFGYSTLFAFLTLPVEFNASARPQKLLVSQGIVHGGDQVGGIKKVLSAAAWTYVAGAVSAVGSLLNIVVIVFSRFRRTG